LTYGLSKILVATVATVYLCRRPRTCSKKRHVNEICRPSIPPRKFDSFDRFSDYSIPDLPTDCG
jgi:hypothetical protein